ncbi:hypothetical protein CDL15_Pgr008210 [Punica granatum]|uniref:Glutamine amidotransferase domain-containing protein n=1 Tax=Punica granatum TaxID=22663 RepID=A0A218VSZ0_PUNGR|nr:hypothetical protein CDL15_Pgr008210 [Punica granatum]
MGLRKFAVLLCAEDSEYVKSKYAGYFGVFKAMLAGPGEEWDVFRVTRGELPRDEAEIGLYDGFVITGSCSDAHGSDRWIHDLLDFLKKLDSLKKKVLGICFGHQVIY